MKRVECRAGILLLLGLAVPPGITLGFQSGPAAVWIGQNGEDRVGPSGKPGPSGVQDVVFELRNLPPGRPIETVRITGKGGDEWNVRARQGTWAAVMEAGSGGKAKVFVEPSRSESGREFQIQIVFKDGGKSEIYLRGGKADPDLRTAETALRGVWIGQDGSDRTGPTAAVGPDGWKDLRIRLERLAPGVEVAAVEVRDGRRRAWAAGKNPDKAMNAEFLRDPGDRTKGDLYFDPAGDLAAGEVISIRVVYENGKKDRADVSCPTRIVRAPVAAAKLPKVATVEIEAQWKLARRGGGIEAELSLMKGAREPDPEAIVLTDSWSRAWVWRRDPNLKLPGTEWAGELGWDAGARRLRFESTAVREGIRFSVRFVGKSGEQTIGEFVAPRLVVPEIESGGMDVVEVVDAGQLASAARLGGKRLVFKGKITLNEPLELAPETLLEGTAGAVLEFEQKPGSKPWGEAIRGSGGWIRLSGFEIRFKGPIEWDRQVPFGPAILGTRGKPSGYARVELIRMGLEAPALGASETWAEAPHTARFMEKTSGKIEECRIQGGMIQVGGGPWEIVRNTFRGPRAGTFTYSSISIPYSRELVVAENTATQEEAGGKAWRFLVQTRSAVGTIVKANRIAGIGPRDDDHRPHPNAPEVILTEGYRTSYEGRSVAVGQGGRLLVIAEPQGETPLPGDVVAIVSGEKAGNWARIDQVIERKQFWLDRPLEAEGSAVVVGAGFVGQQYEENTIDCGGSTQALAFVLAGSHYGTRVVGNRTTGGRRALRLTAFPTEWPVHWGWSFCPTFDAVVERNRAEDPAEGGYLGVERTASSKSTAGRTYFTASLVDNTVAWSKPGARVGWVIGDAGLGEPAEARIEMRGSKVEAPAADVLGPSLRIECGTVNGQPYRGAAFELNRAPASAAPK